MRISLMRWMANVLIWIAISACIGAIGAYFFNVDFWCSFAVVTVALIINGFIAEWEDRN